MQGRQRREMLQACDHAVIDQHGPVVIGTAMHHAVTDGERVHLKFIPQPGARAHQRRRNVGNILDRIDAVRDRIAGGRRGA